MKSVAGLHAQVFLVPILQRRVCVSVLLRVSMTVHSILCLTGIIAFLIFRERNIIWQFCK